MSRFVEIESETHRKESVELHTKLRNLSGQKGRELSDFIAKSSLKSTNAFGQTSSEIVFETTKTIITIFNTSGPKTIGFEKDGAIPKYMVFADIFGKRGGYYSNSPTFIRELCSSFYGQVDAGFGNGSLIRHEIDVVSAKSEAIGASILLVLSSPWGAAIGDRFWRLCTVRAENGSYIDSEYAFCSMQRPPASPGSSVLENVLNTSCSVAASVLCNEWRAINIDCSSEIDEISDVSGSNQSQDSKLVSIMSKVIETLRIREREQQLRISELESNQKLEIERQLSSEIEKERDVWKSEVSALQKSIEISAYEVCTERVRVDALGVEIVHLDNSIIPACKEMASDFKNALSDLCGKQLLLEEELKTCNKKLASARKRDSELKKERAAFESALDAKATELSALRSEFEDFKTRSEEAKKTASAQISSLLDSRSDERSTIENMQSKLKEAHDLEIVENTARSIKTIEKLKEELIEARLCAKWVISIHRKKLEKCNAEYKTKNTVISTESDDESADNRGQTGFETLEKSTQLDDSRAEDKRICTTDLLNLVASTKGLVAHLNSFVEKVQSNGNDSVNKHPQQQQTYSPPQEQWHEVSHPPENPYMHHQFYPHHSIPYHHHHHRHNGFNIPHHINSARNAVHR